MSNDTVTIDRELFEWLVEYALDLRGEWEWRANGTPKYIGEYQQLSKVIDQAITIRDGVRKEGE